MPPASAVKALSSSGADSGRRVTVQRHAGPLASHWLRHPSDYRGFSYHSGATPPGGCETLRLGHMPRSSSKLLGWPTRARLRSSAAASPRGCWRSRPQPASGKPVHFGPDGRPMAPTESQKLEQAAW